MSNMELVQTHGYQPNVPPVFISANCLLYAAGNALIHIDIESHSKSVAFLASNQVATLAVSSDDLLAFSVIGSLTIHIIDISGSVFPYQISDNACQQLDSQDLGILHLAFIPPPNSFSRQAFLLSINDIPNFDVHLWDVNSCAPICKISNSLSDIPKYLCIQPLTEGQVNDLPESQEDDDLEEQSTCPKFRALILGTGYIQQLIITDEPSPQFASIPIPIPFTTNVHTGISDKFDISGRVCCAPRDILIAPHGKELLIWKLTDHTPNNVSHLKNGPWARLPNDCHILDIVPYHPSMPSVYVVLTNDGQMHWVRLLSNDDNDQIDKYHIDLICVQQTGLQFESICDGDRGILDLVHSLNTCINAHLRPLSPLFWNSTMVISPEGTMVVVGNLDKITTINIPPNLDSNSTSVPLSLDKCIHNQPIAEFLIHHKFRKNKIINSFVLQTEKLKDPLLLVLTSDGFGYGMPASKSISHSEHGYDAKHVIRPDSTFSSFGRIHCGIEINGSSKVMIGFDHGFALVDVELGTCNNEELIDDSQLMTGTFILIRFVPTKSPVEKITIDYSSFYIMIQQASSASNLSTDCTESASILIYELASLSLFNYVLLKDEIVLNAAWDGTDGSFVVITGPVSNDNSNSCKLYVMNCYKQAEQCIAATVSATLKIPDGLIHSIILLHPRDSSAERCIAYLTSSNELKVYSIQLDSNPHLVNLLDEVTPIGVPHLDKIGSNTLLHYGPDGLCMQQLILGNNRNVIFNTTRIGYAHFSGVQAIACSANHLITVGLDAEIFVWEHDLKLKIPTMSNPQFFIKMMSEHEPNSAHGTNYKLPTAISTNNVSPLHIQIDIIKKEINNLVKENQSVCFEQEKLPIQELIINQHHMRELTNRMEQDVVQAQSELIARNKETHKKIKDIKVQYWDSMIVKADYLTGLSNPQLKVSNYPIAKPDLESERITDEVINMRKTSMAEDCLSNHSLLYQPDELSTSERIRTQVVLLQAEIHKNRIEFNKKFDTLVRFKTDVMNGRIGEKQDRINDLMEEFKLINGHNHVLVEPIVSDNQLDSCSGDQLFEEYEQIEMHRNQVQNVSNQPAKAEQPTSDQLDDTNAKNERALNDMMGGQLQMQNEQSNPKNRIALLLNSVQTVIKPECMLSKKPRNEYTEEEKRAVAVYEKEVKAIHDEIDKNKRSIEAELRTSQAQLEELKAQFDRTQLTQLFDEKLKCDLAIHQLELQACIQTKRLFSIKMKQDTFVRLGSKSTEIHGQIQEIEQLMVACAPNTILLKDKLNILIQKDKELDKAFKRELTSDDHGVSVNEVLWLLYKSKANNVVDQDVRIQPDHLGKVTRPLEPELNQEQIDIRSKLTPQQVSKLNEYRNQKAKLGIEIRTTTMKLRRIETQNEKRETKLNGLKTQRDLTIKDNSAIEQEIQTILNTSIDLYTFKQGQIEIPLAPVITDYLDKNIKLIAKQIVEELNTEIKVLGTKQLNAKVEMRNYSKQIMQLKYENEVLDFKMQDMQIQLNHFHLLKLNKASMQEYLNHTDSQHKSQQYSLERQLEYISVMYKKLLDSKSKNVSLMTSKLHSLCSKNADLVNQSMYLADLIKKDSQLNDSNQLHLPPINANSSVVGATNTLESTSAANESSLMVKRNKLVHRVQIQNLDIQMLNNEIMNWKLKTYPSFP